MERLIGFPVDMESSRLGAMGSDLTPVDAGVAHEAMRDMLEASRRWNEKRPGSLQSQTYARKAADLKTLRDKILDQLPEQFHEHRKAYPDYAKESGG